MQTKRFKAVETSAKHYLPTTREAPKVISRALQELYSPKKTTVLSVCMLTSELEARKYSHARLKRVIKEFDSRFAKITFGLFVYRPVCV